MVKFLSTRQDWIAERLGVQSLTFSGYLCPGTEKLGDLDDLIPEAENFDQDAVSGLFLLNKTLFFMQQLTRDMVTESFQILFMYPSVKNFPPQLYKTYMKHPQTPCFG